MTGDPLPDDDHFAHYCSPRQIDEEGFPALHAFLPRETEKYLSVNWLEHFEAPSREIAIECVRRALRAKITVRRKGRLWVLNVADAKEATRGIGNEALWIEHLPDDDVDPSHAGVRGYTGEDGGYTEDDLNLAAALQSVVQAVYQALGDG